MAPKEASKAASSNGRAACEGETARDDGAEEEEEEDSEESEAEEADDALDEDREAAPELALPSLSSGKGWSCATPAWCICLCRCVD